MYISKAQAIELLSEHGFKPDQPTATRPFPYSHEPLPGSSFFEQMGDRADYRLEDVLKWLGY